MRTFFITFLLLTSVACKKKSSSDAVTNNAPSESAFKTTTTCGVPLALFTPSSPPVYAPLLQTSTPQLAELIYDVKYRTLLISFKNLPIPGSEDATTADYGKYKICGDDGTCLKSCVNGTCTEEVVTVSWVEEVPIPDTVMTQRREVFSVYTTSCVNASRRMASNTPGAPTGADNPECGAWTHNIVQHAQNGDPQLEALIMQIHQSELNRQALSADLASAAAAYLNTVSPSTPSTALFLAGTGSEPSGNINLQLLANNAIVGQERMGGLLKEGILEALQDATQSSASATSLALAGTTSPDCPPTSDAPAISSTKTTAEDSGSTPPIAPSPTDPVAASPTSTTDTTSTDTTSSSDDSGGGGLSLQQKIGTGLIAGGLLTLLIVGIGSRFTGGDKRPAKATTASTAAAAGEGVVVAATHTELEVARAGGTAKPEELAKLKAKAEVKAPSGRLKAVGWGATIGAIAVILFGALAEAGVFLASTPDQEFQAAIGTVGAAYNQSKQEWAGLQTKLDAVLSARAADVAK